jgi:hypothetical protein
LPATHAKAGTVHAHWIGPYLLNVDVTSNLLHHAVFTDSPFQLVQAESQHRGHAVVEQVFADLIDGPLAHLPSSRFNANAAWLQLAVTAHAFTRALGTLASARHAKARGATIREELIQVAGRLARSGPRPDHLAPARGMALAARLARRVRGHPPRAAGPGSLTLPTPPRGARPETAKWTSWIQGQQVPRAQSTPQPHKDQQRTRSPSRPNRSVDPG